MCLQQRCGAGLVHAVLRLGEQLVLLPDPALHALQHRQLQQALLVEQQLLLVLGSGSVHGGECLAQLGQRLVDGVLVGLHGVQSLSMLRRGGGVRLERRKQRLHSLQRLAVVGLSEHLVLLVDPRLHPRQQRQLLEPLLGKQQLVLVVVRLLLQCVHVSLLGVNLGLDFVLVGLHGIKRLAFRGVRHLERLVEQGQVVVGGGKVISVVLCREDSTLTVDPPSQCLQRRHLLEVLLLAEQIRVVRLRTFAQRVQARLLRGHALGDGLLLRRHAFHGLHLGRQLCRPRLELLQQRVGVNQRLAVLPRRKELLLLRDPRRDFVQLAELLVALARHLEVQPVRGTLLHNRGERGLHFRQRRLRGRTLFVRLDALSGCPGSHRLDRLLLLG